MQNLCKNSRKMKHTTAIFLSSFSCSSRIIKYNCILLLVQHTFPAGRAYDLVIFASNFQLRYAISQSIDKSVANRPHNRYGRLAHSMYRYMSIQPAYKLTSSNNRMMRVKGWRRQRRLSVSSSSPRTIVITLRFIPRLSRKLITYLYVTLLHAQSI